MSWRSLPSRAAQSEECAVACVTVLNLASCAGSWCDIALQQQAVADGGEDREEDNSLCTPPV